MINGIDRSVFFRRLGIWLIGVVMGIIILLYMNANKKHKVNLKKGMVIPEIEAQFKDGDVLYQKDLKGNLVLVDFWASWCAPCRGANVEFRYLYQQYKGKEFKRAKDFEIVSISLDDSKEDWLKAVAKDQITWTSVRAPLGSNDSIVFRYGIKDIPALMLVDSSGRILTKTTNMDAIKFAIHEELK